jgi:hypothetical protein
VLLVRTDPLLRDMVMDDREPVWLGHGERKLIVLSLQRSLDNADCALRPGL